MSPWAQAVFDTLSSIAAPEVVDEIISRDMVEVLPAHAHPGPQPA